MRTKPTAMRPRRIATMLIGIVLAMTLAQPAHAVPARSGTIIGGFFPFAAALAPGPPPECSWNVDCLAWQTSGCNPALVGVDPGLHSSIVDVRKLAGSRKTREFLVLPKTPGIVWGGVGIQFWGRDCIEIAPYPSIPVGFESTARFKIPARAAWMTVASMDDTTFAWELN